MLVALGADASQVGRDTLLSWWNSWRTHWTGDKRRGADSLFVLVACELWKEINGRCFYNASWHLHGINAGATKLGCLLRE